LDAADEANETSAAELAILESLMPGLGEEQADVDPSEAFVARLKRCREIVKFVKNHHAAMRRFRREQSVADEAAILGYEDMIEEYDTAMAQHKKDMRLRLV